jgi:hypothetical protein
MKRCTSRDLGATGINPGIVHVFTMNYFIYIHKRKGLKKTAEDFILPLNYTAFEKSTNHLT